MILRVPAGCQDLFPWKADPGNKSWLSRNFFLAFKSVTLLLRGRSVCANLFRMAVSCCWCRSDASARGELPRRRLEFL